MSGRVVHRPERVHACAPGWTREPITEGNYNPNAMPSLPIGSVQLHPPQRHDYPAGTVWCCDDCGQRWVSIGAPRLWVEFRKESRGERRRRLGLRWWQREAR